MDKVFKFLIGLGFLIVVVGGIIYVGCQMLGLLIGSPELVLLMKKTITKIVYPAAAISGLLCFVYYYLFPAKKEAA